MPSFVWTRGERVAAVSASVLLFAIWIMLLLVLVAPKSIPLGSIDHDIGHVDFGVFRFCIAVDGKGNKVTDFLHISSIGTHCEGYDKLPSGVKWVTGPASSAMQAFNVIDLLFTTICFFSAVLCYFQPGTVKPSTSKFKTLWRIFKASYWIMMIVTFVAWIFDVALINVLHLHRGAAIALAIVAWILQLIVMFLFWRSYRDHKDTMPGGFFCNRLNRTRTRTGNIKTTAIINSQPQMSNA